jgi:hypothetical protein
MNEDIPHIICVYVYMMYVVYFLSYTTLCVCGGVVVVLLCDVFVWCDVCD